MKKTTKEIQEDVNMLEDIIFETSRVLEDKGRADKALDTFSDEYGFFLFANREDDDGNDDNYLHVIESEDVSIRRYFMHTFIAFLITFHRLYETYLIDTVEHGNVTYTSNGNIIHKMYLEYLDLEID